MTTADEDTLDILFIFIREIDGRLVSLYPFPDLRCPLCQWDVPTDDATCISDVIDRQDAHLATDHTAAESWKPVVGWPEYEVSDYGRIRRATSACGTSAGRLLKPQVGTSGRAFVSLSRHSQVTKRFIHHLVLEAFVGPRPEGQECAHGDGNPLNNRLTNIRWDTPSGNAADKRSHGTSSVPEYSHPGEAHPMHVLTEEDVRQIKARLRSGDGPAEIAGDYPGVTRYAITDIRRGKTWRHVA